MEILEAAPIEATPLVRIEPPKDHERIALGASLALETANTIEIDCNETAADLAQLCKDWKLNIEKTDVLYAKLAAPAFAIIEVARGWFKPSTKAYEKAIEVARGKLTNYANEQQRRAEEQRIKAQQERQRVADEAEREAAAARARASAEAERLQKAAQEAARVAATKTGKAASNAQGKAASLFEEAQQALENGEREASQVVASAHIAVPAKVEAPSNVAGFNTRKNWVPELKQGTTADQALDAIIAAIAKGDRPELRAMLCINEKALKAMAKALEHNFNVPGYAARNAAVGVIR